MKKSAFSLVSIFKKNEVFYKMRQGEVMEHLIRLLVASRHKETRDRIFFSLSDSDNLRIIGVEKDEASAIIKTERLKPDILIFDLYLSGMSGPELARIVRRKSPSTAIVLICDKDEVGYASTVLEAGISALLLKETDANILEPVVKIVFSGKCYVSTSITTRAFNTVAENSRLPVQARYKTDITYSPAERLIVTGIARGFSDEEIAKYLNYSAGTIKNCLTSIKRKTRQKNRMQIVLFSLFYGLISLEHADIYKSNRQFDDDTIQ
jgi:DNA-binding NarL/FixJ family response regulator